MRKKVLEGAGLSPVGYKILLEVLVKGRFRGVTEVPYTFQGRIRGRSKADWRQCFIFFAHLTKLAGNRGVKFNKCDI